jgi:hypothetical protein
MDFIIATNYILILPLVKCIALRGIIDYLSTHGIVTFILSTLYHVSKESDRTLHVVEPMFVKTFGISFVLTYSFRIFTDPVALLGLLAIACCYFAARGRTCGSPRYTRYTIWHSVFHIANAATAFYVLST